MNPTRNIAIIGGGLTGLVAGLRLVKSGHRITILEGGTALGGLAATFEVGGEPLEKAYHHLFRTDEEILSLIDELGISDKLEWRESSVAIYRDGRIWPFMTPLDLLRFGACSISGRIRLGLTALSIKRRKNWSSMVGTPALEWMRKRCGRSATSAVWEPLLRGKFSSHAEKVSMAWLWARLHIRSNSREPGGGKERLGYIRGGFIELTKALEQRLLASGASIRTATPVTAIRSDATGPSVICVNGEALPFDAVLFTGSNRSLANLLADGEPAQLAFKQNLRSIDYLGAMCLIFETNQSLGDHYWININAPDSPFLVMIRHTRLIPAERYGGKEIYYLGAYVPQDGRRFNLDEATLESEWFAYLRKIFPEFDAARIGSKHWFRFKDAQHVVTTEYPSHIPPCDTPVPGLFLANFTQIFPEDRGTNFAVREGERFASRFLSDHPGKA